MPRTLTLEVSGRKGCELCQQNFLWKYSIPLTTNVESTQQEKKSTDQISHEYKRKTLNKILADQTQRCTQRLQSKSDLFQVGKVGSTSETQLIFTSTG